MSTSNFEELDNITNKKIPLLINSLCEIRREYNRGNKNTDLSERVKKQIMRVDKLYTIWTMWAEQIQKETEQSQNTKENTKENTSDNSDSGSDCSISDVEYDREYIDDIYKMMNRCEIESRLHRHVKGFTAKPKCQE